MKSDGTTPPRSHHQHHHHYFARLFSRWRAEALSIMNKRTRNEDELKNESVQRTGSSASSATTSYSTSLPSASDVTPRAVSRSTRLTPMERTTKSKFDQSSSNVNVQHRGDVYFADTSATRSPPSSPTASCVGGRSSSQQSISTPILPSGCVDTCIPYLLKPQHRQQQQQAHSVEIGAIGGLARSDAFDRSSSVEFGGGGGGGHVEISCLDTFTTPPLVDVSLADTSSDVVTRGTTTTSSALHGLMEVRLPKFPLKKLRHKQQSFADQTSWKPADNCCWRNTSGASLRLRGARLERLAAVERQALQKLALAHLQKANLGCAILRPKDSLPVRQKRHKYIKRKAHTVNVVDKKDAGSSTLGAPSTAAASNRKSPSPATSQQVFGIPLSQCIENEQQWEWAHQESTAVGLSSSPSASNVATISPPACLQSSQQQQQLHQTPAQLLYRQYHRDPVALRTHQHPFPSTSSSSSGIGTSGSGAQQQQQPLNRYLQQLSDEQKQRCQSLDLDEMEFLSVARASPQRLSAESSKSSLSDQASSDSLVTRPEHVKGSLSNQTSADNTPSSDRRYASSDSLLGSPFYQYSPRYASSPSYGLPKQDSCEPHLPRVPRVVQVCTEYLSQRGLQTIGIFRIAGSAKRCRQLRLELDSGQEVVLNEEQPEIYPHDIATLLKEYFRDLPDPLLTKELYAPFIATAKFPEETRVELLRYLVSLLPLANCDTLLVLLQFLRRVAKHSYDTINDQGISLSGNKMNSHNLATVFGPTILRQAAGKLTQSWTENDAVIRVMETMIDRCDDLFTIPAALQDALYRLLCDTDPDALDLLLRRLVNEAERPEEQEEEMKTAVYFSSQEELDPPCVSKDTDGATVVRTRQTTTHRIVYKIHKPTGRILGSIHHSDDGTTPVSSSPSSAGPSSCDFPTKVATLVNEKFPELSLFAADEDENVGGQPSTSSYADESTELVDLSSSNTAAVLVGSPSTPRGLALSSLSKPPTRKLTPLAKLTEAIRPNSARK